MYLSIDASYKEKMYSFILLAGGKGSRMEKDLPKQFLLLAGKPVIMHVLEKVEKIDSISEVVVVCLEEYVRYIKNYIQTYELKKKYILVNGGESRQESVLKGLEVSKYNKIILHEAARPFVKIEDFIKLIENEDNNIVYGSDIPFTVLQKEYEQISGVLKRESLVNVQLPHKFERSQLLKAHYKAREEREFFTEDASLLYHYENIPISILKGRDYNIKLTTNFDLIIAEEIYKEYMVV